MIRDEKGKEISLFSKVSPYSSKQRRALNIFFFTVFSSTIAAMLAIILYYVYSLAALYHGSEAPTWLLGIFSDFVEIMNVSLVDSPYIEDGASYPPIAIMVLYPLALICKGVFAKYAGRDDLDINELTSLVVQHPQFWVAIVLFFLVCIISIIAIVIKKYRLDLKDSLKIAICISFSAPFVYAIMRGNTIYFALIFLLIFLLLYDSESAWAREIAYLSLAIAGAIKIYPLFFGVFLLRKKKIWASARVAIYFFVIFSLSFGFFQGGSADVNPFVENLQGFMSDSERLMSLRNLSLASLLYKAVYLVSPAAAESSAFGTVTLALLGITFVVAAIVATLTRSNLSRSVICSAIVILIPPITYFYVLVFEIIPFMEYLSAMDSMSKKKRITYGAIFLFILFTPVLLTQFFIPHALAVIFMMLCEEYKVIKNEFIPCLKARTLKSKQQK